MVNTSECRKIHKMYLLSPATSFSLAGTTCTLMLIRGLRNIQVTRYVNYDACDKVHTGFNTRQFTHTPEEFCALTDDQRRFYQTFDCKFLLTFIKLPFPSVIQKNKATNQLGKASRVYGKPAWHNVNFTKHIIFWSCDISVSRMHICTIIEKQISICFLL